MVRITYDPVTGCGSLFLALHHGYAGDPSQRFLARFKTRSRISGHSFGYRALFSGFIGMAEL
jgi:hypothetical protein